MTLKEAIAQINTLTAEVAELKRRNAVLCNKLYGKTSEKFHSSLSLSDQLSLFAPPAPLSTCEKQADGADQHATTTEVATHTRRRRRRQSQEQEAPEGCFPEHLPRLLRSIDELPEGVGSIEQCECLGEEVTERLAQKPSSYYVIRTVRKKYKVKATGEHFCPPAPEHLFGRCMVDESFLVLMVIGKVLWHLPLHRQAQMAACAGITLDRGSMARWMIKMSELFEPIVEALRKELLTRPFLHCDETPSLVGKRNEEGIKKYSEGRFWPILYESLGVVFVYTPTRSFTSCQEVLGNYSGTLVTDAYVVYEKLASQTGASLQLCWMHVRRYFFEAQASNPTRGQQALTFIAKLYEVEDRVKQCETLEQRKKLRQREALSITDEFYSWAKKLAATPEAITDVLLSKAISYVITRWESATRFLYDPALPLDNGAAERSIRPFKLGANNWLFCSSEVGADALVNLYSLVYSARMHGIDPYLYLRDLCDRINEPGVTALELTPARWQLLFLDEANARYLDNTNDKPPICTA